MKDKYKGDNRYEEVYKKMLLLNITDVTTNRQHKNGTIVWQLPIKNKWNSGSFIEVGSFSTGYVRNNNSCYTNYQLNKCEKGVEYWPDHEWKTLDNGDYTQVETGKFNKFVTKKRILIPIEIDRLEHLISYCLKNYYIKHANLVANGEYVHKWELEQAQNKMEDICHLDANCKDNLEDAVCTIISHEKTIEKLQKKYDNLADAARIDYDSNGKIRDLENKLDTIKRIADYEAI